MYRCCLLFRILVLSIMLALTGLAFAGNMLSHRHNSNYYVSLWGARNRRGYYFSLAEVGDVCPSVRDSLAVMASFAVFWTLLQLGLYFITILEFCFFGYRRIFDLLFFFVNVPALGFGLLVWGNGLGLLYGDACPSVNGAVTSPPITTIATTATTTSVNKGALFLRSPLVDDQLRVGAGLALFLAVWAVQILFLTCAKCASNKAYFVSKEGKAEEAREIAAEKAKREERLRRINMGELKEA